MFVCRRTDEFRFCCLSRSSAAAAGAVCHPQPDEFSSCTDLMANSTLRVAVWLLALLSLLGNAMVLVWRTCCKRDGKVLRPHAQVPACIKAVCCPYR